MSEALRRLILENPAGEDDPSAVGHPAPIGAVYRQALAGSSVPQLWMKIDLADTDWEKVTRQSEVVTIDSGVTGGAAATRGHVLLIAGTRTVTSTAIVIDAFGLGSRIFITVQSLGTITVPVPVAVTNVTAGQFTVTSADATDTSRLAWAIL